jgi:glycoprotein-N-acetylgalactosamine 3-beta-galactosyltransferase
VLCWTLTCDKNLQKKAIHVQATWAKRCNVHIFVSDTENKSFPAIGNDFLLGREHLTAKTMFAFDYIYKHHRDDADWFMKTDDDTYVVVENLRYFLSQHDPNDPVYFGHHFDKFFEQGYYSGGGGYVLSRAALDRFGKRKEDDCVKDLGSEDKKMGQCMVKLGVRTGDSRDSLGRTRFHCFTPETFIRKGFPSWYMSFSKLDTNLVRSSNFLKYYANNYIII